MCDQHFVPDINDLISNVVGSETSGRFRDQHILGDDGVVLSQNGHLLSSFSPGDSKWCLKTFSSSTSTCSMHQIGLCGRDQIVQVDEE